MVAHLDAVTSLAVDPNGLYLLSGSEYKYQNIMGNILLLLFSMLKYCFRLLAKPEDIFFKFHEYPSF